MMILSGRLGGCNGGSRFLDSRNAGASASVSGMALGSAQVQQRFENPREILGDRLKEGSLPGRRPIVWKWISAGRQLPGWTPDMWPSIRRPWSASATGCGLHLVPGVCSRSPTSSVDRGEDAGHGPGDSNASPPTSTTSRAGAINWARLAALGLGHDGNGWVLGGT
jgi:hypothetical protein